MEEFQTGAISICRRTVGSGTTNLKLDLSGIIRTKVPVLVYDSNIDERKVFSISRQLVTIGG